MLPNNRILKRLLFVCLSFSLTFVFSWLLWSQTAVSQAAEITNVAIAHNDDGLIAEQPSLAVMTVDCSLPQWVVSDSAAWNEAISCFNSQVGGSYEITFQADIVLTGTTNISNTTGASLYIQGNGYTLDGDATYLVMRMDNGLTTVDALTVTNGYQSATNSTGAGIYIGSGAFTVTNSAILNNSALGHGGGIYAGNGVSLAVQNSEIAYNESRYIATRSGAGIYVGANAVVTVSNSLIHDNESSYYGGGIHNQKGLVTVIDSAIYDNESYSQGGAIMNYGGEIHVINTTISGNTRRNQNGGEGITSFAPSNGTATTYLTHTTVISNENSNIYIANLSSDSSDSYLYVYNSIIAYGTDQNCTNNSTGTRVVEVYYSLSDDGSCLSDGVDGNVEADPEVDVLQDNGGDTMTHALPWSSPAINGVPFGTSGCGTTYTADQRGETRPNATNCDIGAFELIYCSGSPYVVADDAALGVAVDCYNATESGQTVISFTNDIVLTNSLPNIDNSSGADLYVYGNGHSLDGAGAYLVMRMDDGLTTVDALTITNGYQSATNSTGAGIYIGSGAFTVTNSAILNNSALGHGGGIYAGNGVSLAVQNSEIAYNESRYIATRSGAGIYVGANAIVTVSNSLIHDNESSYYGGGIHNQKGLVTVIDSAIYDNESYSQGGAIMNYGGEIHVINTTISGNTRRNQNGGEGITSFAPSNGTATTYLTHTTVISNENSNIYLANLSSSSDSYLYVYNSIVAYGTDKNCTNNSTGTRIVEVYYSLSDDGSCLSDGVDGNVEADPEVGVLQDNGGDTMTHALDVDSPAVNQIPFGAYGCGTTYVADQRGEDRFSANCDMGAYELDYCTAVSVFDVADEANLNWAIDCFNQLTSGEKVISLTADITLVTDTTTIDNGNDVLLSIVGNGQMIDGADVARPLAVSGTEINIHDITLTNGYADSGTGGAININGGSVFTLTDSILSNSVGASGGGLYLSNSDGRIERTTILGNEANNFGGGGILARDGSQVDIIDTMIMSNTSANIAGGIRSTFDAIITVTNSTIAYNEAITDAGGVNANRESAITLINSTVSHNHTGGSGGGIYARGDVNISYTTIASNTAGSGGGLYLYNGSTLAALEGVILAYNSGADCDGTVIDNGSNLASDASCGFTSGLNSTDPLLESLADNGGATETHALDSASPAVDQVSVGVDGCGTAVSTDQRGVSRPITVTTGGCDIGAFERVITSAVAPNITIHETSGTVTISWVGNGNNESYDLYLSTTPYGEYGALSSDVTSPTDVVDDGSQTYSFYQVVANGYGFDTADSNEVGVFHFSLTPGE